MQHVLHDILHYIPQGFLVSIMFTIVFLWLQENKNQSLKKIKIFIHDNKWMALFLLYAAYLFTCTILARTHTYPFSDMLGELGWNKRNGKFNAGGLQNILIFIPYTCLFAMAFKPEKTFQKCFILTIITTACIEIFQMLFWIGELSLADLLHNTIGGLLGFGLWYIINRANKIRKRL